MAMATADAAGATDVQDMDATQVGAWLRSIALPQYAALVAEHRVDGNTLLDVVKRDVLPDLGIADKIHQCRIRSALGKLARASRKRQEGADAAAGVPRKRARHSSEDARWAEEAPFAMMNTSQWHDEYFAARKKILRKNSQAEYVQRKKKLAKKKLAKKLAEQPSKRSVAAMKRPRQAGYSLFMQVTCDMAQVR